jgi:ribulose-bisphosphate carboxylase large chain
MNHPCTAEHCENCYRFGVWYRLTGTKDEALAKARDICLEQTVEFPGDLVPPGFIQDEVIGQVAQFEPTSDSNVWRALITYLNDDTGFELPQLLNVLYGNISLKKGFKLENLENCHKLWNRFKGPKFGQAGLRKLLNIPHRPLLCSPIKPMGLPANQLADLAYKFAAGGIDIIKDDHGLANQPFASFAERVERCAEAVQKGSKKAGRKILYAPNVTAPAGELEKRVSFARQKGATALLICPGLTGFDSMRLLADDETVGLPIFAHPAFLGSFVTSPENGISHFALFGQLMRLAGADASIYPHSGGRFGFTLEECREIIKGSSTPMGNLKTLFPTPGGGMNLKRIPELMDFYGNDVMFLVGGDLVKSGPDIEQNCAHFLDLVEKSAAIRRKT